VDAAWPLQGGRKYKSHRHQTRSEQAEKALEYGTSLSTLRCERPGQNVQSPSPNSIPRSVNHAQSCHSSNKYTPKPPRPRIQPPGEWRMSPVGGQLIFLQIGSLRPDGLERVPVSVTEDKSADDSGFSRGHGTTRIPRVFAEPTTVLAMASNRRCLR